MRFGSFSPGLSAPTLHALRADDIPMYFDMDNLTPKQAEDFAESNIIGAMLQTCMMGISKPEDYIAVFAAVTQPPFDEVVKRYNTMMQKAGLSVVPLDHLIPTPVETFYEHVADNLPEVDVVDFMMVSPQNQILHGSSAAVDVIYKLNSKYHFAQNAPTFGIPVPESLAVTPPLANQGDIEGLFSRHKNQIMMKLDGMPGGRNVIPVSSVAEADNILTEVYPTATEVVLQQRLNLLAFEEWTVDLLVTDDAITVDNTRHILLSEGNWVGNHIPPVSPLTSEQEALLINVGKYAQSFGFGTPEGSNLGIDYFIGKDGSIVVTEINPRWTAGLLPSEVLKRVGSTGQHTIAYFDMIKQDDYEQFFEYVEQRLPGARSGSFDVMPIGFSPYPIDMEGTEMCYVWIVVRGDFVAYRDELQTQFGQGSFPVATQIPVDELDLSGSD
ncbi:MAG: hypothetical protein ABGY43_08190 [bacterium]